MSLWALVGIAVLALCVLLPIAAINCAVRQGRARAHGGLLELDTREARAAFADPLAFIDATTATHDRVLLLGEPLRRCRPERRLHYHGGGDRCECGQTRSTRGEDGMRVHPFAPRTVSKVAPTKREVIGHAIVDHHDVIEEACELHDHVEVVITLDGAELSRGIASTNRRRQVLADAVVRDSLRRCKPSWKLHYHGEGDRCECGAYRNRVISWWPFANGDAA